jgi:hypothetical protein
MDLTEEQVKSIEEVFQQNLPPNKDSLTLKEFKKIMPSKNVRNSFYFLKLYYLSMSM